MSTVKKFIAIILCLTVFTGIFSTVSYALPGAAESAVQAETKEEPAEETPDVPVTFFGWFELSSTMARIFDAFPVLLIVAAPFLAIAEIPYVIKDIFSSIGSRFAD